MSTPSTAMTAEERAKIVPPAQSQTTVADAELLHSGNAGVVVCKAGQARSEYRSEARMFARELAKHVNNRQTGNATAFVYEETFGAEDRLHWFIQLRSLDTYYRMVEMGDQDRAYRASLEAERVQDDSGAKGAWDRLFVDGSLASTVLLPVQRNPHGGGQPRALDQIEQPSDLVLHSANAGIVIHRVAQIGYGVRAQARRYAWDLAAAANRQLAGDVTVFLYEEAFGATDRLHWLLHLKDLTSYRRLLEIDQLMDDANGLFVEATMADTALTPHHWGLYGTQES
jgi:Family of unknown function (DUF6039)